MSEHYPGSNPFESGNDDAPESASSKKSKNRESKPAGPPPESEQAEKQPSVLDKLLGEKPAARQEAADAGAEADEAPEMTKEEAAEALSRMAEARELEVGATELHEANAAAAETAEAEAAVELLQHVKAETSGNTEGITVSGMLAAAERRTLEALGLAANETAAEDTPADIIIDTHNPNEAELPLGPSRTAAEQAAMYSRRAELPPLYGGTVAPPERIEYIYYGPNTAGTMMLGGIIGYLVGKRRGRIKTEKKLLPVQHKLEREVGALRNQLLDSELRVRRLAAEKARGGAESRRRGAQSAERIARPATTESRLRLQKPERAERVGKVLVGAETRSSRSETITDLSEIRPDRVRTMALGELLLVSEKIIIEGSSLRKIFEAHLIGERGLRRLVAEHLRGKDIRKRLRREMVEREIDFERDPILRDKAYKEAVARSESQTLEQLLQKAGVLDTGPDALPGRLQQERFETAIRVAEHHRRAADTAMITVIVVLAIAVVLLILGR